MGSSSQHEDVKKDSGQLLTGKMPAYTIYRYIIWSLTKKKQFRAHLLIKVDNCCTLTEQKLVTDDWPNSPCTRLCQKVSPSFRVKELCPEHWSKVLILKVWRIVFLHEFHKVGLLVMLPAVPKPFCFKTWY